MKIGIICLLVAFAGCHKQSEHSEEHSTETSDTKIPLFQADTSRMKNNLEVFTSETHPLGSDRQKYLAQWLMDKITALGEASHLQHFQAETPKPQLGLSPLTEVKNGYNVVSLLSGKSTECSIWFASHYDTKYFKDFNYLGANDSGSSSIALLEILSYFTSYQTQNCRIGFIWFDGEESTLANWNDGETKHPAKIKDHTYGSAYFASSLTPCSKSLCYSNQDISIPFSAIILLDMIGSPNLKITLDSEAHSNLNLLAIETAKKLGYSHHLGESKPIEDDHREFIKLYIPAVDIIDFSNLNHWHKESDKSSTISYQSMSIAAEIAVNMALEIDQAPSRYLN